MCLFAPPDLTCLLNPVNVDTARPVITSIRPACKVPNARGLELLDVSTDEQWVGIVE